MSSPISNTFDLAKKHYLMDDSWGCVVILLKLLKVMRKKANWPVITFKDYQTLRVVFHEGKKYAEAAKILGVSRQTVNNRIKKIKNLYPDLLDQKGRLQYIPLPEDYELYLKEAF